MAMHVPRSGLSQMMKDGSKQYSGIEEAVMRNITACKEIAQIVRSSFGPNGMNKIIVNHLDKIFVTNDAATIVRELEVEHPAAKMVVLAAQQQEQEVGDGTNFVITFAGKLLEKAEHLLRMGLTPTEIIYGYEMAAAKALETLPGLTCYTVQNIKDEEEVIKALSTSIASKQYGYETFLSGLITKACISVLPTDNRPFNIDYVRMVKIVGAGALASTVVNGLVFPRESGGVVHSAADAKVAVFSCPVDWTQTETKGTVLIKNAKELKEFSSGEENLLEEQIKSIKDAGVKVVVSGGKIGDMAQHFLNKYGLMSVKIMSKHDLRRLCKAVGATPIPRLTAPTASELGFCSAVVSEEIGDTRVTVFRQVGDSAVATIVIRGATDNIMDDLERACDDGINNYKTLVKDGRYVPGAGATEIELASQLAKFAVSREGLEQYSIAAYGEALEAIPHALADNAGFKPQEVVSKLYAAHAAGNVAAGLDNQADLPAVCDATKAGILDLLQTKHWAIHFATNAAVTVLRVDTIIMSKPAGGPKAPKQGDRDDD